MIGKFLENEENESAVKTESNQPQTKEANPADVFSLPRSQEGTDFQNSETENQSEINYSGELDTEQRSAINIDDYTVAPPDAIVPATIQTETKTQSLPAEPNAETVRKTGLAWSAATVLGGSVVFMMVLGWFFDLVFGSKPWGIVGGIVLGSIVGFIQFFRITSRIFKNDSSTSTGILDHRD